MVSVVECKSMITVINKMKCVVGTWPKVCRGTCDRVPSRLAESTGAVMISLG